MLLLLVSLISLLNCNVLALMRIVNGTNAQIGSAKFQVWVRQMKTETIYRMCGGILFAPNKVLTAAHCLIPGDGQVTVRYGTMNLKNVYKPDVAALRFVIHPKWYRMNHDYDIAVIILSQNIPQDDHVSYAVLEQNEIPYGTPVDIYGWGYTSGTNRTIPFFMQHTELETEYCFWTKKTICGRSQTSIACQGDSGSSMIAKDGKAVGVLSAVAKGCTVGGINIYTKISAHRDFIEQNM